MSGTIDKRRKFDGTDPIESEVPAVLRAPASLEVEDEDVPDPVRWPFKRILNGHIMVKIDKFKYGGRIKIPRQAQNKPTKGRVIGIAENVTDIEVGDKILYSQFAGYLLEFSGIPKTRCIGRDEVLAILWDDAPDVIQEGS